MSPALVIVASLGFVLGFFTGRWGALITGVVFAIWIGLGTEADEVAAKTLVLRYGGVAAVSIAVGIIVRRQVVARSQ
jgi:hypothetical protein